MKHNCKCHQIGTVEDFAWSFGQLSAFCKSEHCRASVLVSEDLEPAVA